MEIEIPEIKKHKENIKSSISRWKGKKDLASLIKELKHPREITRLTDTMPSYLVVETESLRKALGLKDNEPVAFVAGAGAGLARSLKGKHPIEFTDASESYVNAAKNQGINGRTELAEEFKPTTKHPVIVSVEPYPIFQNKSSLMLSLLNLMSHGRSIIFMEKSTPEKSLEITSTIDTLKDILNRHYKADVKITNHTLVDKTPELEKLREKYDIPNAHEFVISRLDLNEKSRKLAKLDLDVIKELQNKEEIKLSDLASKLNAKESEIEESLRRISLLKRGMDRILPRQDKTFVRRRILRK